MSSFYKITYSKQREHNDIGTDKVLRGEKSEASETEEVVKKKRWREYGRGRYAGFSMRLT